MNFIDAINSIDWSKNIIMLVVYTSIIMICSNAYLIPIVEEHKDYLLNQRRINNLFNRIDSEVSNLQKQFELQFKQNKDVYDNIRKAINTEDVRKYLSQYISNIKVEPKNTTKEGDISITSLHISGSIEKSENIIDLINKLNNLDNSVRISFPLDIKKNKNKLDLDFYILLYYTEYEIEV